MDLPHKLFTAATTCEYGETEEKWSGNNDKVAETLAILGKDGKWCKNNAMAMQ